jgi:hypothetical protein
VIEKRALTRIFKPKGQKLTGGWIKLRNEDLTLSTNYKGDEIMEDEMSGAHRMHRRDEKFIPNFQRES